MWPNLELLRSPGILSSESGPWARLPGSPESTLVLPSDIPPGVTIKSDRWEGFHMPDVPGCLCDSKALRADLDYMRF